MWKKQYSLAEFTNADQFKSYADLETRLNRVLNTSPSRAKIDVEVSNEEEEIVVAKDEPVKVASAAGAGVGDEDALSYFQKLAEE